MQPIQFHLQNYKYTGGNKFQGETNNSDNNKWNECSINEI